MTLEHEILAGEMQLLKGAAGKGADRPLGHIGGKQRARHRSSLGVMPEYSANRGSSSLMMDLCVGCRWGRDYNYPFFADSLQAVG